MQNPYTVKVQLSSHKIKTAGYTRWGSLQLIDARGVIWLDSLFPMVVWHKFRKNAVRRKASQADLRAFFLTDYSAFKQAKRKNWE